MITAPLAMPSRCVFDGTVPTGGNASRPLAWESATMTIKTTTRFLAAVPALPVSDEQGTDEGLGFLRRTRSDPPVGPWRERAWRGAPPGESSSCRIEVTGVDELYKGCE